ncbi:hypothetical protein O181_006240 [Austropuccinia psidii MF-1]|uniref:Uncharacterized protein n=1 Tax=Austropuccinia psidii MF-1 TaxID=1389203 RepID=A0A9Q3GGM8_9BASI|nr:hypothetical protein [Austropuccinia psidii MF-1]
MERHLEKSYSLCHSLYNSTETSNKRTGRIWINFFSSTNSSKIFSSGSWTTRILEGYGSISSAPPTPQRSFPVDHGQQEVQPSIPMGRTWRRFPENMSQRDTLQRSDGNYQRMESHQDFWTPGGAGNKDKGESSHYPRYRRTAEPDRAYSDSFRLTRSRPTQLSSGFTPFRH